TSRRAVPPRDRCGRTPRRLWRERGAEAVAARGRRRDRVGGAGAGAGPGTVDKIVATERTETDGKTARSREELILFFPCVSVRARAFRGSAFRRRGFSEQF